MRKTIALLIPFALTACAGTVQLNADRALLLGQVGFKSFQQTAYACIAAGTPVCVQHQADITALVVQGQSYENTAYAATDAAERASAAASLTSVVAQLAAILPSTTGAQ